MIFSSICWGVKRVNHDSLRGWTDAYCLEKKILAFVSNFPGSQSLQYDPFIIHGCICKHTIIDTKVRFMLPNITLLLSDVASQNVLDIASLKCQK
jgi:hypothetical protein